MIKIERTFIFLIVLMSINIYGCAVCEYESYLQTNSTKASKDDLENMKRRQGVVVDFGFNSTESRKGIPYVFEIIKSKSPFIPGIGIYSYTEEFKTIEIQSILLIINNYNINILGNDNFIKKELIYNKFYNKYEAHQSFKPIEIDFNNVNNFYAEISIVFSNSVGEHQLKNYKYEFKKKYSKGVDFFHAWSGD